MSSELQKIPKDETATTGDDFDLTGLIKTAEPLIKILTDSDREKQKRAVELDNEKHRRVLEYENNRLQITGRQNLIAIIGLFASIGLILITTIILFISNRDSSAIELIKIIVIAAGSFFGGYGIGMRKSKSDK